MKAKKSYGQHFLTNEHLAEKISKSLQRTDEFARVLEVGPGKGMLTKYLIERDFALTVVEADRDMIAYLEEHYPALQPHIVSGDFLKVNLAATMQGKPFGLIGNFPYNISSQIVFKMIKHRDLVPEMVGMFQKEMADRIIAPPGNKTYGVISVLTQAYYEGEMLFKVSRGSFNPPPKVESAVIRLSRKENFNLECDERLFRTVVKQAFNQRRKMLRNTLKSFFQGTSYYENAL
ncbi:MAG: 16S rRNA (adenine(1518)-N(6)/adenine(1519)-N(6))-dimethyltransferase RsmA, partial [Bacteroidota bacterium]